MKTNFTPSLYEEMLLWDKGYDYVIGIDEVGKGAFAGPVVAAAVVYPKNYLLNKLSKIHDSKLLKPLVREALDKEIRTSCQHFGIGLVDVPTINKEGIGKATFRAVMLAIEQVYSMLYEVYGKVKPLYNIQNTTYLLVDGFGIPQLKNHRQKAVVKGDQKCLSIAAASIIAKVYRDALMQKLHDEFPQYSFAENKGYGTKSHRDALKQHGLCDLHRTSFNLGKYLGSRA